MDARDIIIRPIVTERSMDLLAADQYTFEVDRRANKTEVKKAIETMFDVKVAKVNTMNVPGKPRRMGRSEGHTSGWKKAIVTLKEGTIELFEGMI